MADFDFILSNRLEILYNSFKQIAFDRSHPFKKRIVIVYGPAMKNWLMLQMANDLKISFGLEIIYLNEAFEKLLSLFTKPKQPIPTSLQLSFSIEKIMRENKERLLEEFELENASRRKIDKKLVSISQQLTQTFKEYGRFCPKLIAEWEKSSCNWKQSIWNSLNKNWTYPIAAFQQECDFKQNCEIHFFSISYITPSEFQFLQKLSSNNSVYYYLLSPCALFWSDMRKDLEDRNSLLANFGRIGREMARQIEESEANTIGCYVLPNHSVQKEDDLYLNEDIHFIETNSPLTLLHAVQSDLILMRNLEGVEKIPIDGGTIQLHVAPNKRREIEILYHNLLAILDKNPSIHPGEIIVMAPKISEYLPYIQSIFGSSDSLLKFQILDLGLESQGEMGRGLFKLFALSESRWEVKDVLELFDIPAFQRKYNFSLADLEMIKQWIEKTAIRWGENVHHRNELLKRFSCNNSLVEESSAGTWEHGFTRLLMGLTMISEYPETEFSETELLGKWIQLIHQLRDDLDPLSNQSEMTIEEWVNYLNCLIETYFQPDFEDPFSKDEFYALKDQFEVIRKVKIEGTFPFISIKTRLTQLLEQKGISFHENQLEGVQFCSLIPLRCIPRKVLALIGMDEESFPRYDFKPPMEEYIPTRIDQDRYLFLEMLHSTQDILLMSYIGYSKKENKELKPSLLIQELLSYLDRHYLMSAPHTFVHPFDSYDDAYFVENSVFNNYSMKDFNRAVSKRNQTPLSTSFNWVEVCPKETIPSTISIRDMSKLVKNPMKFYLNKGLEIYLETEEDRSFKDKENLALNGLDKFLLKKEGLSKPLDTLIYQAEQQGKLPFGQFKNVALNKIMAEMDEIKTRLKAHSISPVDLFSVELKLGCTEPTEIEQGQWVFPPLSIPFKENPLLIVGEISQITPKGLFCMGKNNLSDIWKIWPQFLVHQQLAQLYPDKFSSNLVLTDRLKTPIFKDSSLFLNQFLEYYSVCLKNISPLIPEWVPTILEGNVEGLDNKISQFFSGFRNDYQSLEAKWIFNKDSFPSSHKLIEIWKDRANHLLDPIVKWIDK